MGDAGDVAVAERAAGVAESLGSLSGWVNNAAVFRDASLHRDPPAGVVRLIEADLVPAIVGCAVAVRRFRAGGGRVNAMALGSISTDRYESLRRDQDAEEAGRTGRRMTEIHPLGRVGRPDEVGDAVAYLPSDTASFVTGTVLPADARPVAGPGGNLTPPVERNLSVISSRSNHSGAALDLTMWPSRTPACRRGLPF